MSQKNPGRGLTFTDGLWYTLPCLAGVSESADETDSKSVIRKGVWVQVPPPAPKKSYHFDTTFFIHYGVMAYHHATCLRAYHQKERFPRSFLHIITLQRVLKLRNDDIFAHKLKDA